MILELVHKSLRRKLKDAGIESADLESRIVLKHVLGIGDADLITGGERKISGQESARIDSLFQRRLAREPLSRILGQREFHGLIFRVTPDVLDPRPDTETLVDAALLKFKVGPPGRVLDLGTGTGCILIALLKEWPQAEGVAVDISESALDVAKQNAKRHGVENRIAFLRSDWFEKVQGTFDLIVSNPPYIPCRDIPNLDPEVKNHDPILALSGGEEGLDVYKMLITETKKYLRPGGAAFFEIGFGQQNDITRIVGNAGATLSRIYPDLGGIPRVAEISYGDN